MQLRRASLAAFFGLLLAGCWNGRILFSFEQPFWSVFGDERGRPFSLAVTAATHGYLARIEASAPGADPLALLQSSIASQKYGAVVVGPLLSLQWREFVPKFSEIKFVLIDAPAPAAGPPPNAVFLTFDRTGTFREAGRTAAEYVRGRFGAANEASAASGLAPHIVVLTGGESGLTDEETDAFSRGVADTLEGGAPPLHALPPPIDAKSVKAAVEKLHKDGAEVFLLGLGEHDPEALEALRDTGGRAVVADWQASGAFAPQVLVSVEEDVSAGIARALDALRAGAGRVQGPVRLAAGKKI